LLVDDTGVETEVEVKYGEELNARDPRFDS
jgi:hypothetical protein